MDFRVQTASDRMTVFLSGQLGFDDNETFRSVVKEITQSSARAFSLDLRDLEHVDSAGLGLFLIARETAEKANASFSLSNPKGMVKDMLEVAQFGEIMTIE